MKSNFINWNTEIFSNSRQLLNHTEEFSSHKCFFLLSLCLSLICNLQILHTRMNNMRDNKFVIFLLGKKSLLKKWNFSLRIYPVNVTKSLMENVIFCAVSKANWSQLNLNDPDIQVMQLSRETNLRKKCFGKSSRMISHAPPFCYSFKHLN